MTTSTIVSPTGPAHDREQRTTTTVAAALDGDPLALRVVMAGVRPAVLRYCRARLGVGDLAGAVAVDVSRVVEEALSGRARSGLQIHAFVYAIVSAAVDVAAGPAAPGASAGVLPAVLARLATPEREALVLRVAVGLTVDETAAAVGSSSAAVRISQHRALERMREASSR